jgi:Flp pilus assembly protein TadG
MRTTDTLDTLDTDRGSMAVEIVILVPMLLMIVVLVVAMGRYVTAEGDAESAAREAVRSASLQRDPASALLAARRAAVAATPATLICTPATLDGAFVAGGTITAEVSCEVSWANLGLIGLGGVVEVTGSSSAPLDLYRRTGA